MTQGLGKEGGSDTRLEGGTKQNTKEERRGDLGFVRKRSRNKTRVLKK